MPKANKHATTPTPAAERGVWRSEIGTTIHELRATTGILEHLAVSQMEVTGDDLGVIEADLTRAIDRLEVLLKPAEGQPA